MDVEASEAQMPGGGRTPVMACMPCERRLRSTGDATESFCQFGFTANVIYGALRQVNPVLQRLNRGFPLAPGGAFFFLSGALKGLRLTLRGFASFSGLFFADGAGALVRANDLPLAYRVKPLAAFFVCALTAR